VTIAGKSYKLPEPFFVLATQNPIEQEGTYPLPEAQLDRFMFNVWVDYPSVQEEIQLVQRTTGGETANVNKVLKEGDITFFQNLIKKIPVPEPVLEYAVRLVVSTRKGTKNCHEYTEKYLSWGAGPRASQYLIMGAKTHAALNGKYSVDIEDVKAVALPVLRHRLILNYHADAENLKIEDLISALL
jgi:MoxR-like ATPase